ncbi:group III truncated hemoglobin [Flavobacterium sp.]|uniref:group III truncated hemoglobin n=1 Tax=Flavobacterium sp. TaxID=239 RepID=UPI003BD73B60
MKDIQNQEDLYEVINDFYKKLLADEAISYIFTDVVKIKLEDHLPILVAFWSQSILGTGGYFNNLTQIHLDVNAKSYLSKELFEIWLNHFEAAINENFYGINCERMKNQAHNLSTVMQIKIAKEREKE